MEEGKGTSKTSKSPFDNAVSSLVRAAVGSKASQLPEDPEAFQRAVIDMLTQEAREKNKRYEKEGVRAFLDGQGRVRKSPAPSINKRFLLNMVKDADSLNERRWFEEHRASMRRLEDLDRRSNERQRSDSPRADSSTKQHDESDSHSSKRTREQEEEDEDRYASKRLRESKSPEKLDDSSDNDHLAQRNDRSTNEHRSSQRSPSPESESEDFEHRKSSKHKSKKKEKKHHKSKKHKHK